MSWAPAQPVHPVLAGGDATLRDELVGDEPIPEDRVVGVDVPDGVGRCASDQFRSQTGWLGG